MAVEAPPIPIDELNKVVQHNLNPDPSWEQTGQVHIDSGGNRYPVYRETITEVQKVPKRDADGQIMYHLRPDGSRYRVMMEEKSIGTATREFVLVPVGNGITQKNYHFRPSEAELKRKRLEREEATAMSELGRALKESGKGFADLVAGLKSSVGLEPRTPAETKAPEASTSAPAGDSGDTPTDTAPPAADEGPWPKHLQFGRYSLSDGSEVSGKEAAIAAQALLDAAAAQDTG